MLVADWAFLVGPLGLDQDSFNVLIAGAIVLGLVAVRQVPSRRGEALFFAAMACRFMIVGVLTVENRADVRLIGAACLGTAALIVGVAVSKQRRVAVRLMLVALGLCQAAIGLGLVTLVEGVVRPAAHAELAVAALIVLIAIVARGALRRPSNG